MSAPQSRAALSEQRLEPGVLTVLMPVYNEMGTIRSILERVAASPVRKEIVIVDDASTDGTRAYLRDEVDGRTDNVRVVYLPENGGKGTAIRAGLEHVRGEFVVVQDGDLEYDPNDYAALLEPIVRGEAPIAYGNRFANGYPPMRAANRLVNIMLAWMVRVLYRSPMSDEATCYKMFRTEVLRSLPLTCRRFEFCPEVTAKALRRGYRIAEVPISYRARSVSQGKKIRWTDGVTAVWTLLRYRFWR